ncbi:hypothetical protein GCM10007908_34520 [Rhizobium albus]|nr:hypothetical protein GCM10007908_34520 [Rhizobium albus]
MTLDQAADYLAVVEEPDVQKDLALTRLIVDLRSRPELARSAGNFQAAFFTFQRALLEEREDAEDHRFHAMTCLAELRRAVG